MPPGQTPAEKNQDGSKSGLDGNSLFFYLLPMKHGWILLAFSLLTVTLHAEPANEKLRFESDTNGMSKEEVKMYMGRDPDQEITPHLWRYSGNWSSKKFGEGMDTYNTVDLSFGMLTDSHKYGVTGYYWSVQ